MTFDDNTVPVPEEELQRHHGTKSILPSTVKDSQDQPFKVAEPKAIRLFTWFTWTFVAISD